MKKVMCWICVCSLVVLLFGCGAGKKAAREASLQETTTEKPPEAMTAIQEGTTMAPETAAALQACKSAVCFSVDEKELLFSKKMHKHIQPASMAKLLTACTALQFFKGADVLTVGSELSLVHPESSLCLIAQGQKLTFTDLLKGLLIKSGNDAAYTLAVSAERKAAPEEKRSDREAVQAFCARMNALAKEIGMTESNFTSPEGWDDPKQYTTVSDLMLLANYALTKPLLRKIMRIHQESVTFYSGQSITWTNSNQLLDPGSAYYYPNTIGMKTGTTTSAGACLVAAFKLHGRTYITIVAGCASNEVRYKATLYLFKTYCAAPADPVPFADVTTAA